MKRFVGLGMLVLSILLMAGCAMKNSNPYPQDDLTHETWSRYVNTNPNAWARGSDGWFLTGSNPIAKDDSSESVPVSSALSTMMVRVPDFNNIKVDGPFEVQIFGASDHNSVYLYGPNEGVRGVVVEVRGNTLHVHSSGDGSRRVVVRIGVMNLNSLTQLGCGRIEGRQIRSNMLDVVSKGTGNIYLSGRINLRCISQFNDGSVSVFGAYSRMLDIDSAGKGSVNVSGNVALRKITHHGRGDINIIGANGGCAKIYADGSGKVGIYGRPNIREITAKDDTCVLAYCIYSDTLYVYVSGRATVGLAGYANDLFVTASGSSQFEGRSLMTQSAYVRARGQAHINATANNKMYASSTDSSSIYFFGTPNLLSQFTAGGGTVIPIWFDKPVGYALCTVPQRVIYKDAPPSYKREVVRHRPRPQTQSQPYHGRERYRDRHPLSY
jgi:hypothetical protein